MWADWSNLTTNMPKIVLKTTNATVIPRSGLSTEAGIDRRWMIRKEKERAQDPKNGSRGSDADPRLGSSAGDCPTDSRGQVDRDVRQIAVKPLDQRSNIDQAPHVDGQVNPAAMHEDAGEEPPVLTAQQDSTPWLAPESSSASGRSGDTPAEYMPAATAAHDSTKRGVMKTRGVAAKSDRRNWSESRFDVRAWRVTLATAGRTRATRAARSGSIALSDGAAPSVRPRRPSRGTAPEVARRGDRRS